MMTTGLMRAEQMTAEQKAAREGGDGHDHGEEGHGPAGTFDMIIRVWAGIATIMALLWLQGLFRRRKSEPSAA